MPITDIYNYVLGVIFGILKKPVYLAERSLLGVETRFIFKKFCHFKCSKDYFNYFELKVKTLKLEERR